MNRDARITLYGGVAIGVGMLALGIAVGEINRIAVTGLGFMGASALLAFVFDFALAEQTA